MKNESKKERKLIINGKKYVFKDNLHNAKSIHNTCTSSH